MNASTPIDRSKADRPVPKPGILDIHAYVPGKGAVEGIAHPVKLSANENILGCSPKAQAAFAGAADRINIYPEGRSNILRAAVESAMAWNRNV